MRFKLVSDVHSEYMDDHGVLFFNELPNDVDVLILAGDICDDVTLSHVLDIVSKRFADIVYVPGNHEVWGTTFDVHDSRMTSLDESYDNVHVLNPGVATIHGSRIVGCTMWFRKTMDSVLCQNKTNDFRMIREFTRDVYDVNKRHLSFLHENVCTGDIVVTHHLPSLRSVPDMYIDSPTNCYFVCELDEFIKERKPMIWCHGHTHSATSYTLGETRVICNPRGYVSFGELTDFDAGHVIDTCM